MGTIRWAGTSVGMVAVLSVGVVCARSLAQEEASQGELQGTSLLGRELRAMVEPPDGDGSVQAEIEAAQRRVEQSPDDRDARIALGIALARAWRYREAIDQYDQVLEKNPDDAYALRLRGHRFISLRDFDRAVTDLDKASRLDSDDFDIWYHLGLAHYLRFELDDAEKAYRSCLGTVEDDDSRVAVSHWLYMTLRRAGKRDEAAQVLEPIHEGMSIEENGSYYALLRFYKGELPEREVLDFDNATPLEVATSGYGIANWHLYNSDGDLAFSMMERVVAGPYWPAFGFIAAEAELARLEQ